MYKLFIIVSLFIGTIGNAANGSKQINEAVNVFSLLAESGVQKFKVKPARTVKEMLYALALKEQYVTSESEFSWLGSSGDAWEADSTNWGSATMKEAFSYITQLDDSLNEPGNEKAKEKALRNVKKAKEAFKLLLGSGVEFGVVPMGAVQCGVTFAALAIIDPATGTIYVFAKEGSGC